MINIITAFGMVMQVMMLVIYKVKCIRVHCFISGALVIYWVGGWVVLERGGGC